MRWLLVSKPSRLLKTRYRRLLRKISVARRKRNGVLEYWVLNTMLHHAIIPIFQSLDRR